MQLLLLCLIYGLVFVSLSTAHRERRVWEFKLLRGNRDTLEPKSQQWSNCWQSHKTEGLETNMFHCKSEVLLNMGWRLMYQLKYTNSFNHIYWILCGLLYSSCSGFAFIVVPWQHLWTWSRRCGRCWNSRPAWKCLCPRRKSRSARCLPSLAVADCHGVSREMMWHAETNIIGTKLLFKLHTYLKII